MRKVLAIIGLFFATLTASAQATLGEGNTQLNAGVGLSGRGIPLYVGLDYGVTQDITVGGEFSYRTHTHRNTTYTGISILANGNYHFNRVLNIPSEIDFYAGLSLGYYHWTTNNIVREDELTSELGFGAQIGGRYFFSDDFGVNLEIGGGSINGAKLGITYKF